MKHGASRFFCASQLWIRHIPEERITKAESESHALRASLSQTPKAGNAGRVSGPPFPPPPPKQTQ